MAATKVGIIYSIAQRRRRWMVVPDSDAELPLKPRAGEAYIEQPITDYQQRGPDAAVLSVAGGPPLSDRCAIIDQKSNTVLSHCHADPAIDVHPSGNLVQSDLSIEGDILQGNVFLRRFAITDLSGKVTSIVTQNAATPPGNATRFVFTSLTAQVGDVFPIANTIPAAVIP